jgi:hypothetical protein
MIHVMKIVTLFRQLFSHHHCIAKQSTLTAKLSPLKVIEMYVMSSVTQEYFEASFNKVLIPTRQLSGHIPKICQTVDFK